MKKKEPQKSTWNNFLFVSKKLCSTNKYIIVLRICLLFSSIFVSLFATYENKLLLDLFSNSKTELQLVLMVASLCFLYGIIHFCNLIINRIFSYFITSKVYYKLYLSTFNDLKDVDYDKLEMPEYKNLYIQYKRFATTSIIGEFNTLSKFVEDFLKIIIFGSMVSILNPFIAVGIIALSVIHFFIRRPQINFQHKMNLDLIDIQRKFGYSTSVYTDFTNAKEVRLYNMEPWLNSITDECMESHKKLHNRLQRASLGVGFSHQFLRFLRDGFAYIYLIFLFKEGNITAGEFVLFFTAITNFSNTLNGFSEIFNELHKYDLQITDMRKLQKLKSSRNRGKGIVIPYQNPIIELRDVSFKYPNSKKYTLRNISLKIKFGEKIAIVGVNGAGKTTLIKLICGLYTPTEGEILLNNRPLADYNIEEYYSMFSAVFQDINLMPLTIAQNIACTIETTKIDTALLKKSIELAGLSDKILSLKNGVETYYDKEINPDGVDFSGGEKQKISLARAIYMNRPILVLDEPTSSLDSISEKKLYLQFNEIANNKTAFFISHRLASTKFCDKIIHLENGRIIEEGSHLYLISKCGKYSEMYDVQKKYYEKEERKVINEN